MTTFNVYLKPTTPDENDFFSLNAPVIENLDADALGGIDPATIDFVAPGNGPENWETMVAIFPGFTSEQMDALLAALRPLDIPHFVTMGLTTEAARALGRAEAHGHTVSMPSSHTVSWPRIPDGGRDDALQQYFTEQHDVEGLGRLLSRTLRSV